MKGKVHRFQGKVGERDLYLWVKSAVVSHCDRELDGEDSALVL